jgi:prepilin-type N-terminal cleavage/methylation domain-containing protein
MKKMKSFTLIELLVVIGIIGILATIVIPAVGNALADAKRTSAQAGCKSYEDSIFQADTKHSNLIKNSAKAILSDLESKPRTFQNKLFRVLAGNIIWKKNGGHEDIEGSSSEGVYGEYEISCANKKYYESLIDPGFFSFNDNGTITRVPNEDDEPPVCETKFGTKYQVTYRQAKDKGTIFVSHPVSGGKLEIHGIKRYSHPVRIVTFDDEEPAKLITRDGSFRLFGNEKCTLPITGDDWETATEAYVKNK